MLCMIKPEFRDGLLPVIVQDSRSRDVLMFAHMNEEAFKLTLETGLAHYYSRSRGKLWKKGEESGHVQHVKKILIDCDRDCLLLEVDQDIAACHTGYVSCFYRSIDGEVVGKKAFDPATVYGKPPEKNDDA
jgi:phosphoribosyl-AMP cyclohydrolase